MEEKGADTYTISDGSSCFHDNSSCTCPVELVRGTMLFFLGLNFKNLKSPLFTNPVKKKRI